LPLSRPTLAQIRKRIAGDFQYETGSTAARIDHTVERGYLEALSGSSHGLHGRLDQAAADAFAQTASEDRLVMMAGFFNVQRNEATAATGFIEASGVAGTVIPVLTVWTRPDGAEFKVTAETEITADPTTPVPVRAVVKGLDGNTDTGVILTVQEAIAGLNATAAVDADGLADGADQETVEELRARLLQRLADPSFSGGPGSYVYWAKLVSGTTRAWEFGGVPALGSVTVLFLRDNDDNPFGGNPATVQAKIEEYAPIDLLDLQVAPPTEVNPTVEITLNPNTATVQAAVKAAIVAMNRTRSEPAEADGVKFYRSWIMEAISLAAGEVSHTLVTPAADITMSQLEMVWFRNADISFV